MILECHHFNMRRIRFWPDPFLAELKVEDFRFRRHIDHVPASVKNHVRKKMSLVNLTSIGTGDSDTDGHFVFHQIWQVVIWTITGR